MAVLPLCLDGACFQKPPEAAHGSDPSERLRGWPGPIVAKTSAQSQDFGCMAAMTVPNPGRGYSDP